MRILLLNPPFLKKFSRPQRSPAVTKSGTLYFPIWLAYAAGVLEEAGFEVEIAGKLKDNLPESFIVLVGTHVSALPQETLDIDDRVDAIAQHEYEYTLRGLA